MITQPDENVKCSHCGEYHSNKCWRAFTCWVDQHPRYWWFWTVVLSVNTLLNVLDLFGWGQH